jgi:hypothetical protein
VIQAETAPYIQHKSAWDDLLKNDPIQYPLGSPLDQTYCEAYAESWKYDDISILVHNDGKPLAGLQISLGRSLDGQQALDFYGRPCYLRLNRTIPILTLEKAQKLLTETLSEKIAALEGAPLHFMEMCSKGELSDFCIALLKAGFHAAPYYTQILDLQESVETLKQGIRKSYKSLISWGEKNLSPVIYDSQTITEVAFRSFHALHVEAAGRETRSKASWDIQLDQIRRNEAFLVLGTLDDKPVSGALFLTSPAYCYYGVGASDRALFEKPLSHAILWAGILEAKRKGMLSFEMGELVHLYDAGYSEKEKNISLFKSGFGGSARIRLSITKHT